MTEPSSKRARVPRLHLPIALKWSAGVSALATLLIVALLWVQMAAGNDPSLGPKLADQRAKTVARDTGQSAIVVLPTGEEGDEGYGDGYATVPVAPQPAPAPAPVQTSTS